MSASAPASADAWSGFVESKGRGIGEMDFTVPGMHCAGCMKTIEAGLPKSEGVEFARANLSTKRVHVRFDIKRQSVDGLRSAFDALGFTAAPFDPRLSGEADKARGRQLLRAIAVSGFATANIMLLSVSVWAGLVTDMDAATRELFHWLSAMIALPAVAYAGRPFFHSAYQALKARSMNMDVPISLAVILAAGASLFQTVKGGELVYFDASVMLLFFLLIGRYLDIQMRGRATDAARNLIAMRAASAVLLHEDGRRETVSVDALRPGLKVVVAPGMQVPADGRVIEGASDVDTSLVTGESVPEKAAPGAQVYAGMMNLTGPLTLEVTAAKENTLIAEIARLLEAAEQGRAGFVRLADKIARLYAPAVHVLAAATFAGWIIAGAGWHPALMIAVATLIITCPCALGLAVPVVQVVASGSLLKRGVLVKSADGLEKLAKVDTVVFDKTGTLTDGAPSLVNSASLAPNDLALAAALGGVSKHPLSDAVARAGETLARPQVFDLREEPGHGVEGTYDGRHVRLGRRDWCGVPESADVPDHAGPELWLSVESRAPVRFLLADRLRADAAQVVNALKRRGLAVTLLSGDRRAPVAEAARTLGIQDWHAQCRPADKIAALERLKAEGRTVLMVGDGLNDAPALRAAHVSLSPASAADISQTAADFVFQGRLLAPVLDTLALAGRARRRVIENFAISFAYNAVAIPLAIAGFVTPLIAAIAMSASSLTVTLNALRLRLDAPKTAPASAETPAADVPPQKAAA